MGKLDRAVVIAEALDLLDEVGLDAVTTRALARRLGVEQPSLYWHFRNKDALLTAMADAAMAPHADQPPPQPDDDWREWFRGNFHSLRRTLLQRRDGARLHAGTTPDEASRTTIIAKIAFLTAAGVPEQVAATAMLAAGRFTVGSVLEEQTDQTRAGPADPGRAPLLDHQVAFGTGLDLIVAGLESTRGRPDPDPGT